MREPIGSPAEACRVICILFYQACRGARTAKRLEVNLSARRLLNYLMHDDPSVVRDAQRWVDSAMKTVRHYWENPQEFLGSIDNDKRKLCVLIGYLRNDLRARTVEEFHEHAHNLDRSKDPVMLFS